MKRITHLHGSAHFTIPLSQQSKHKQNKIKIKIFTAMFLMQYFCLQSILLFPESYPETESTWPTTKCKGRKYFDMWYYSYLCNTLRKYFIKIESNCFPKHILKSNGGEQSIQASKKLFCHVIVKNYLCSVSWKFLIKIERGGTKSKNRHPSWLYCTVMELSEATPEVLYKLFLNNFAVSTENTCAGVYFSKCCRPLDLRLY